MVWPFDAQGKRGARARGRSQGSVRGNQNFGDISGAYIPRLAREQEPSLQIANGIPRLHQAVRTSFSVTGGLDGPPGPAKLLGANAGMRNNTVARGAGYNAGRRSVHCGRGCNGRCCCADTHGEAHYENSSDDETAHLGTPWVSYATKSRAE